VLQHFFFGKHLDDEEQIILIVQKNWFCGVKVLYAPTLVFIALWTTLYFVRKMVILYGLSLASIGILIWWMRNFLDYYLDAWIVTNMGVIEIQWHGWFHRSSSRVLYSDIQGIGYDIHGILGTLFQVGTVSIEKLSTGGAISMEAVRKPKRVEMAVLEAMEAYMLQKNLRDTTTVQNILTELVTSTLQKKHAEGLVSEKLPKKE
jgi:hypothetical protein